MIETTLTYYVDCDDTLVRDFSGKRIPMTMTIEFVKRKYAEGHVLYCWSTNGAAYSERVASELDIHQCFAGFLPKPAVMIDDHWTAKIVHPMSL